MHPSRLHVFKVALAAGLWLGACGLLVTASALLGLPGFQPFAQALETVYGPWGYSVSWPGALIGLLWGFVEGFVHVGVVAWLYNWLLSRGPSA